MNFKKKVECNEQGNYVMKTEKSVMKRKIKGLKYPKLPSFFRNLLALQHHFS